MHNGRIQQTGSPTSIYDEPVNEFVAGFIGTPPINFMRCRVTQDSDGLSLVGRDGFALRVQGHLAQQVNRLPVDSEVTLGIRPERVALETGADGSLPLAYVHTIEPEGNEAIVSVRLGTTIWKIRTVREQADTRLQRDLPVYLRLDQGKLKLFAVDTGQRLQSLQALPSAVRL
jgi:multiple sugar transport system ATP-binding protein